VLAMSRHGESTEEGAMIKVFVPGIPQPGGSKRAFYIEKRKRVVVTEANKKSKPWRLDVAYVAKEHIKEPLRGPLEVHFRFVLPRPKSHFRSGKRAGEIRESAPRFPTVVPDTTKLIRCAEDALKGIAWIDDSQVVIQHASKHYGTPGCEITISELADA
jgi:Holliday junction resolvase RusA-like endonuclease